LKLKLSGTLPLKDKYSLNDLIKLKPEADMEFKSLGIGLRSSKIEIKDIIGNAKIARHFSTDGISFSYKGQRISFDGTCTNLPAWIAGQPVNIKAVANLSVDKFMPSAFVQDSASMFAKKSSLTFPEGIELDINLRIDSLTYKKHTASNIEGRLIYKPGLLSFKSFYLNSLDGNISGDCFLSKGNRKSFVSRGSFNFEGIDIHKAFVSFNNFGQSFIIEENLAGSISGKLSLLMPLDSLLNPIIKATTGEGKFVVTNGSLINFEPVKSLSSFIEISELEKIKFSRLENDFYIKNNYIAIPQMDIRSSASDFYVSGKHDFDNKYEYHVKMYLSELLSKKTKKRKTKSEEFGAIEEDGLGRTSVFLKITGTGEDIKVGYDLKAASGNIKKSLKTEKESLKSILNKEYGWYKKDSTIIQETAPVPKFRIQWDETDTTNMQADTSQIKKESGLNSIFKKKKK
jgi:hypothetical protein